MRTLSTLARGALCALLMPATLVACGGEDTDETPTPGPEEMMPDEMGPEADGVTWHADIAPIIAQRCAGCHVEGGVAPFPFDDFESASAMAAVGMASIDAGRMPPWQPDPDCREFEHQRVMPESEKEMFRAWVAAGSPEGDPSTAAPIDLFTPPTFEPTHIAAPVEAYTPPGGLNDDYRCFVLDVEFAQDMFLTASQVVPDADALVHHVLVYAVAEDDLDGVFAADEADPGSGYTCFGGPVPQTGGEGAAGGLPTQIAAWVPGSNPQIYEDGIAVPITAGSRVVMQVHYNLIGSASEPDATTVEMRLTDETPDYEVATRPLIIRSLDIPAGEAEAHNVRTYRNHTDKPLVLGGVAAHMHLLGQSLTATIGREDGTDECLLDIPDWDFSWQQGYRFPEGQWVEVQPGESITLECVYDNSEANQPFVDGEQIAPRDVTWGDGTLDEMCMLYMTIIRPYVPPPPADEQTCAPSAECVSACVGEGRGTSDCLIKCSPDTECTICALRETIGCSGGAACTVPFLQMRDSGCLETCFINAMMIGGDLTACFADTCPEPYGTITTCLDDVLDSGSCDETLASACDVDLGAR